MGDRANVSRIQSIQPPAVSTLASPLAPETPSYSLPASSPLASSPNPCETFHELETPAPLPAPQVHVVTIKNVPPAAGEHIKTSSHKMSSSRSSRLQLQQEGPTANDIANHLVKDAGDPALELGASSAQVQPDADCAMSPKYRSARGKKLLAGVDPCKVPEPKRKPVPPPTPPPKCNGCETKNVLEIFLDF